MKRLLAVVLLLIACLPAYAQDSLNVQHVASLYDLWSGTTTDIQVQGDYAFVGTATTGLRIVDISEPVAPVEVSYLACGTAAALQVRGDYAYIADNQEGLIVVDISDPVQPAIVGSADDPFTPDDIAIQGDYVYVLDESSGVFIYNISDPASPTLDGGYNAYVGKSVAVNGDLMAVQSWETGFFVLDISDPAHPEVIGQCAASTDAEEIVIDGNHAYVAMGTHGFRVVNLSDPTAPVQVEYLNLGRIEDVDIAGSFAYLSDAYDGLRIYDITLPHDLVPLGVSRDPGDVNACAVVGDYAYALDEGLWVLDVSDPISIVELGEYHTLDYVNNVTVNGGYAYIAAKDSGFRIVDISNPATPVEVAVAGEDGRAQDAFIRNNILYGLESSGLRLFDVSDPTLPAELGYFPDVTIGESVVVDGDYAYIADIQLFRIVDISDPTAPVEAGTIEPPDLDITDVAISGDYAFITNHLAGVRVIDVSDPTSPAEVGFFNTNGSASGIVISGDYAYVADGSTGLVILDISDPTDPTWVDITSTMHSARDIAYDNGYVYIADGDYITVMDVHDPTDAIITGYYQTEWYSSGIDASNGIAFVASSYSFGTYNCRDAAPPVWVEVHLTPGFIFPMHRGDVFDYDARLESNLPGPFEVDVWTDVVLPNNTTFGPVWRINNIPMEPGTVIEAHDIGQLIPGYAPYGEYSFRMKVGAYPNFVADMDEFEFYVVPGAAESGQSVSTWTGFGYQQAFNVTSEVVTAAATLPDNFSLSPAWPNPFNPSTTLNVNLPDTAELIVAVYNVAGQQVAELAHGSYPAGSHTLTFDASLLSGGVYFVRVSANTWSATQKLILLK